jgi:hypothetical protein
MRERAPVKDTLYQQDFTFHVYEIGSPGAVVTFAAGEFSPCMCRLPAQFRAFAFNFRISLAPKKAEAYFLIQSLTHKSQRAPPRNPRPRPAQPVVPIGIIDHHSAIEEKEFRSKLFLRMKSILACFTGSLITIAVHAVGPDEFVVWSEKPGWQAPEIVLQFDPSHNTGFDWKLASARSGRDSSEAAKAGAAVEFLREGIQRMTRQRLGVINSNDLSRGIVLTTLDGAPAEVRNDPEVIAALCNDGSDPYNHREAFFIRSEPERVLIVAVEAGGLAAAVSSLLQSVGYEVLGMGPNWIHVPDARQRLTFQIKAADRPTYYLRGLTGMSGQPYGVGTIINPKLLTHPADETVDVSYRRWQIGQRLATASMPPFPGHAMQAYHTLVLDQIRTSGIAEGFLGTVKLGPDSDRPAAGDANRRWVWINTDAADLPGHGKVFHSDGKAWLASTRVPLSLDLSVPAVRRVLLDQLKQKSEVFFASAPNEIFIFGTDPEDGTALVVPLAYPNWYPEYLRQTDGAFGRPYALHGLKGLNQPEETWDPAALADTVYGCNNWLLREYDRWIDSLPQDRRVTASGRAKKEAVRCSLYSYNHHDVPPNFNLDPRIRVMIAGYPKHRGRGKWKAFATQTDIARALQVMLPKEPSGDYWIISLSNFWDRGLDGLAPKWDASPEYLSQRQADHYTAGFRAVSAETDFNFGRMGLGYYLLAQVLWNVRLSAAELDVIRNRWLQRAFGSGWRSMKEYYDFTLLKNYPVNAPHAWSRAIRLIDAADQAIDESREPAAQRRLDDLKQYWYFYYLVDTGQDKPAVPAMRELMWKGQMSYANASHMIARTVFNTSDAALAAGEFSKGPAHYTAAETAAWWKKILDHWPLVHATRFEEITLANGQPARDVDLNDLVAVHEFGREPASQGFYYNAGYQKEPDFCCSASRAGQEIGFQLHWPADPTGKDHYYSERDVSYGIARWDKASKTWDALVDHTTTSQPSVEVQIPKVSRKHHLVTVRFKAPDAGTYRFTIGRGGNLAALRDLGWSSAENKQTGGHSLTFIGTAEGLTQSPAYIYIPKGTRQLDLEVWDSVEPNFVTLYKALPPTTANLSRKVEISKRGTHRIALQPEEAGTIAQFSGNGFSFPFLYSVPMLWAKSPGQLLVPRAIAEADGLTSGKDAED